MRRLAIGPVFRSIIFACICLGLSITLSSCYFTSVGHWNEDSYLAQPYGNWRTVHVCVYLDEGVSKERAISLMSGWTKPDGVAHLYHMDVVPMGFWTLPRPGFLHNTIMTEVAHIPIKKECDRVFYFAKHSVADYVYANAPTILLGVLPPEVLGEVDDTTMTHGWAFAAPDSVFSALDGPQHTTWHELYHLLGSCPHAWTLKKCYARISMLKRMPSTDGMYPSMNLVGNQIFTSRALVNKVMAGYSDRFMP
jgi:hypothetical protein